MKQTDRLIRGAVRRWPARCFSRRRSAAAHARKRSEFRGRRSLVVDTRARAQQANSATRILRRCLPRPTRAAWRKADGGATFGYAVAAGAGGTITFGDTPQANGAAARARLPSPGGEHAPHRAHQLAGDSMAARGEPGRRSGGPKNWGVFGALAGWEESLPNICLRLLGHAGDRPGLQDRG